jgi:putative heme-binding domain-containing protein
MRRNFFKPSSDCLDLPTRNRDAASSFIREPSPAASAIATMAVAVGPELTLLARQGNRETILRSIIEPNRDVAPQYYATFLELEDGGTFTGILLRSAGYEIYRNNHGEEVTFQKTQIAARKQLTSSLMPQGLIDSLTLEEVRDLLEFLATDRAESQLSEGSR